MAGMLRVSDFFGFATAIPSPFCLQFLMDKALFRRMKSFHSLVYLSIINPKLAASKIPR
jgi:hypothetical protein